MSSEVETRWAERFSTALEANGKMAADPTLSIRVNGEHRRVAAGSSLADLARELGLDAQRVGVERNLEVVPRSQLADTPVEDGDDIEIITFVGGG